MGPQVPSETWFFIGICNGCQMCVRGVCSVSVFHVSSQRDEQGSSWRWTETTPTPPPLTLPPFLSPLLPFQATFSRFPQCNILVLIKGSKDKHSVIGEQRKIFWLPGEPDFTSSHYKSHGSFNTWMVMPCSNVRWDDYKGVQGELVCYCLWPWYLILCSSGALQSNALSYDINFDL